MVYFSTGDVLLLNTELNCKDKHFRISEYLVIIEPSKFDLRTDKGLFDLSLELIYLKKEDLSFVYYKV